MLRLDSHFSHTLSPVGRPVLLRLLRFCGLCWLRGHPVAGPLGRLLVSLPVLDVFHQPRHHGQPPSHPHRSAVCHLFGDDSPQVPAPRGVLTVLLLLPLFLDALACVLVRDGGLSLVF